MTRSLFIITFLSIFLISCKWKSTETKDKSPDTSTVDTITTDTVQKAGAKEEKQEEVVEVFPPVSFVKQLKAAASDIVLLRLIKVDSVFIDSKIFRTEVIKVYKGNLHPGQLLNYAGMSEKKYPENPRDTSIVFLHKYKKALPNYPDKNLYYSTVEDNAQMDYLKSVDSLLRIK